MTVKKKTPWVGGFFVPGKENARSRKRNTQDQQGPEIEERENCPVRIVVKKQIYNLGKGKSRRRSPAFKGGKIERT